MSCNMRAHRGNMLDGLVLVVGTCYRQAYSYVPAVESIVDSRARIDDLEAREASRVNRQA